MFLALLDKLSVKTALILTGSFFAFWIAFGIGWHFCNQKHDAQFKNQYNILVDKVNQSEAENRTLSAKYHKNLSNYQNNVNKISVEVADEIKSNSSYNTCILSDDSVQLVNAAISHANKVKPS